MTRKTELRGRAARLARLLPAPSRAAKTPFVLLVVVLLGGGLLGLLVLNSSLNEGSFQLSELQKQTTDLTDEEQALQRQVNGYAAPGALEHRARHLGMVPGGDPAFLQPDGTVRGVPSTPGATPLSASGTPPASLSGNGGTTPGATRTSTSGTAAPGRATALVVPPAAGGSPLIDAPSVSTTLGR
ncbi:septum formation initiator family protein [Streptomyces sp. TS71-3]|uniref:septum formation initiator family protein n=1 Tax=Streptomyces sp. TS71-3 TaxID=2733862 RepID=UPI001B01E3C0|nr:septum formation initiator family protein [Streptomyces sp. TS71-3]GHJ38213.1 membrane protein [Streptomyces sp. TS71-3]